MTSLSTPIHGTEIRKKAQKGLSTNLLRAMQVAGSREDGKPKKLSQQLLSDSSGVARSTISKYLTQESEANPDLETLCRLAASLNISPALLLMTEDDWLHLAHGLVTVAQTINNEQFDAMARELGQASQSNPLNRANAVLKMAEHIGVKHRHEFDEETPTQRRVKQGILTTAALPMHPKFQDGIYAQLLPLCIVMGARIIDQGNQA
ncbi:helix-turn-helix domain-containing protein [Pseudomonas putida]|uniref:helix-turn-helix domain-containing protein n=1 Tax=Pseudomonas putida TaxID=303 RepID=UPI0018AB31C0|nr:helix-turn-helix domain-containing protein [Pseudomonas putida]MBF8668316.1 helix-turn-helix domain-containing protein [Pseudomonas putida]MBF8710865.1 helix-turn-helix domain-containing protein [Pseudomonas putida]